MKDINTFEKNRVSIFGLSLLMLILITSIGFAYFSSTASNVNNENYSLETATISLKFADGDNGVSDTLNLGESIIKKFTLENTGTKDAYARINWVDLINTYTFRSLSYVLEQSETENGTYTKIESNLVPISSEKTTKKIKDNILIPVNTTYYYKLTITLNNLNTNQNMDASAHLNSKFNIEESNADASSNVATKYIKKLILSNGNPSSIDVVEAESVSASCTNTLAFDDTFDNNLRYVGANPCNYVLFNNELWRIIGVMNNIDDGQGNKETRLKIIRREKLGNYSWDTSDNTINSGYGINEWPQADIKRELNEDYLNVDLTSNTFWYNGRNNKLEAEFDYTTVLKMKAQNLIGLTKWQLGTTSSEGHEPANVFYSNERGTSVLGDSENNPCSDGYCPRSLSWIGKVALIYPSDFGYAAGGDVRSVCLKKDLSNYNEDDCYLNNWITPTEKLWFLTSNYNGMYNAFRLTDTGVVHNYATLYQYGVYPTVFLKSNVQIISGTGQESDPYILN